MNKKRKISSTNYKKEDKNLDVILDANIKKDIKKIEDNKKILKNAKMYNEEEYAKAILKAREDAIADIECIIGINLPANSNPANLSNVETIILRHIEYAEDYKKFTKLKSDVNLLPKWMKKFYKLISGIDIERNF